MRVREQDNKIVRLKPYLISILKRDRFGIRFLELIRENPLYKGVFIIGSGGAISQLIGIVSMPIITRLYTPSELGVLAVYTAILAIIGIGVTLRYEFASALPKDDEEAVNIFGLCLLLLLTTTTVLAFTFFFQSELLFHYFDVRIIEPYFLFLVAGYFGMGLYTILNYWAIRQRDYERITYTKINQGFGGALCKILFGLFSFGAMGLIIGHIVSLIAGIETLGRAMLKKEKGFLKIISFKKIKSVARKYINFPLFDFPSSILNTLSQNFPPLMLLALYDTQMVGYYALASTLTISPGSIISNSMGQAYFGEAAKMVRENKKELKSLYIKTLKHLSLIAIPLIGIPALCAPFIIPVIFGESWVEAGWYCLPLAFLVISSFVVSPTSKLVIYGFNHWALFYNIILLLVIIGGFYLCLIYGLSAIMAVIIYVIIRVLMNFLNIVLNIKAIDLITR